MNRNLLLSFVFFFKIISASAQTDFYASDSIQTIEIHFDFSNWDFRMDTAKHGMDDYTMAASVSVNGQVFNSVGVKYKGNSSYDSTYKKNPLHIELNHYIPQTYLGIEDIKLSNCYADPSMIREVLAYGILGEYMYCGKANFAKVYINGDFIGLYSNTQNINKKLCLKGFFSSSNTFVKCNPSIIPGPANKSNFRYLGLDSSLYVNFYEIKSDEGWNDLVELCNMVTNHPDQIDQVFDVDKVLWMLAFNNVLVNLDSYSGAFVQNYYVYRDEKGMYNPIVWDLNMAFGGFPYLGSGASSMGSLTISDMQLMPAFIHTTDSYWPLIKAMMANAMYKRMYVDHMKTIIEEQFVSENYLDVAESLFALIESIVIEDTNTFFSYSDYQNSLDIQVQNGSYFIPGIRELMTARTAFLLSDPWFTAQSPIITDVEIDDISPAIGQLCSINVLVTDATNVYLGYSSQVDNKFVRIEMFDDGMHGDGIDGDGNYGVQFTMESPLFRYYIYAENEDAGTFMPQRAEFEFYELKADVEFVDYGELSLNEFMAWNEDYEFNEYWGYGDWIELYNNSDIELYLGGCYLSDSYSRPLKFRIPEGTVIGSKAYLIIWADEEPSSTIYVHAPFNLASEGEKLVLSDVYGNVIDSLGYNQQLIDVSMGRCPDGTGPIVFLPLPSFLTTNCLTVIEEINENSLCVYPNPAQHQLSIHLPSSISVAQIKIYSSDGRLVLLQEEYASDSFMNISVLSDGMYYLSVFANGKCLGQSKLIKFVPEN